MTLMWNMVVVTMIEELGFSFGGNHDHFINLNLLGQLWENKSAHCILVMLNSVHMAQACAKH